MHVLNGRVLAVLILFYFCCYLCVCVCVCVCVCARARTCTHISGCVCLFFFDFILHFQYFLPSPAILKFCDCLLLAQTSTCNARDLGLIPGLGRSPGGGHGDPLQYPSLENPQAQRSLAGYSPCGREDWNMTERLITAQHRADAVINVAFGSFHQKSNHGSNWQLSSVLGQRLCFYILYFLRSAAF